MCTARPILPLAVVAILLACSAECLTPILPGLTGESAQECCAKMPCTPANQTHDCCKTMASGHANYFQPTMKASLQAPGLIAVAAVPKQDIPSFPTMTARPLDAHEDSPPRELYIVYLSLLI